MDERIDSIRTGCGCSIGMHLQGCPWGFVLELQEKAIIADQFYTRVKFAKVARQIRAFNKETSLRSVEDENHKIYNKVVLQIKEEGAPKLKRVRPLSNTRWFWGLFGWSKWKEYK